MKEEKRREEKRGEEICEGDVEIEERIDWKK